MEGPDMSTAYVNVIHSFPHEGKWVKPGYTNIDAATALRYKESGYLEIITVDGERFVNAACCTGHDSSE